MWYEAPSWTLVLERYCVMLGDWSVGRATSLVMEILRIDYIAQCLASAGVVEEHLVLL